MIIIIVLIKLTSNLIKLDLKAKFHISPCSIIHANSPAHFMFFFFLQYVGWRIELTMIEYLYQLSLNYVCFGSCYVFLKHKINVDSLII